MQFLQIFFKYQFCYLEKCTKFKIHSYLIFFSYFTGHNWLNAKKCTSTSKMICQKIELPFYPSNYHNCLKKFFTSKLLRIINVVLVRRLHFTVVWDCWKFLESWTFDASLIFYWTPDENGFVLYMKTHLARHYGPKNSEIIYEKFKTHCFLYIFLHFFLSLKIMATSLLLILQ